MQDVNIEGFQLSPQQRHLWKLVQEQDGDSPYLARCVVRIRGLVDLAALRMVLEELPARHEIMRTTFYASEEMSMPLQVITAAAAATAAVEYLDLGAVDGAVQRSALDVLGDRMNRALAVDPMSPALMSLVS